MNSFYFSTAHFTECAWHIGLYTPLAFKSKIYMWPHRISQHFGSPFSCLTWVSTLPFELHTSKALDCVLCVFFVLKVNKKMQCRSHIVHLSGVLFQVVMSLRIYICGISFKNHLNIFLQLFSQELGWKQIDLSGLINIHEPLFWLACWFLSDARLGQPQVTRVM